MKDQSVDSNHCDIEVYHDSWPARGHSLAVNKAYYLCRDLTEETEMRKHRKDNVTEVVEEAPHEGADQAQRY